MRSLWNMRGTRENGRLCSTMDNSEKLHQLLSASVYSLSNAGGLGCASVGELAQPSLFEEGHEYGNHKDSAEANS